MNKKFHDLVRLNFLQRLVTGPNLGIKIGCIAATVVLMTISPAIVWLGLFYLGDWMQSANDTRVYEWLSGKLGAIDYFEARVGRRKLIVTNPHDLRLLNRLFVRSPATDWWPSGAEGTYTARFSAGGSVTGGVWIRGWRAMPPRLTRGHPGIWLIVYDRKGGQVCRRVRIPRSATPTLEACVRFVGSTSGPTGTLIDR